jgi:hypothetical protein
MTFLNPNPNPNPRRGQPADLTEETVRTHVVAAYCTDSSLKTLATECGVSTGAIRRLLTAEGVPIRKPGQRYGAGRPIVPGYEIDTYEDAVTHGSNPNLPSCNCTQPQHPTENTITASDRRSGGCGHEGGCTTTTLRGRPWPGCCS